MYLFGSSLIVPRYTHVCNFVFLTALKGPFNQRVNSIFFIFSLLFCIARHMETFRARQGTKKILEKKIYSWNVHNWYSCTSIVVKMMTILFLFLEWNKSNRLRVSSMIVFAIVIRTIWLDEWYISIGYAFTNRNNKIMKNKVKRISSHGTQTWPNAWLLALIYWWLPKWKRMLNISLRFGWNTIIT